MAGSISLATCPLDIWKNIAKRLALRDLIALKETGDSLLCKRFDTEPIVTELSFENVEWPKLNVCRLLTALAPQLRILKMSELMSYGKMASRGLAWASLLPATLEEIDFAFIGAVLMWLRPAKEKDDVHWTMRTAGHAYVPLELDQRFPRLRKLKLAEAGLFNIIVVSSLPAHLLGLSHSSKRAHHIVSQLSRENTGLSERSITQNVTVEVTWTDFTFAYFVKRLPRSLLSLRLATPFTIETYTSYLPPRLQTCQLFKVPFEPKPRFATITQLKDKSLKYRPAALLPEPPQVTYFLFSERKKEKTSTISSVNPHTQLPDSLFESLTSYRYNQLYPSIAADFPRFQQLQNLNVVSSKILGSQLSLLPQSLTQLAINCLDITKYQSVRGIFTPGEIKDWIRVEDLAKLPRSICKLRLHYFAPLPADSTVNFAILLPPAITSLAIIAPQNVGVRSLSQFHLGALSSSLEQLAHLELSYCEAASQSWEWVHPTNLTSLKVCTNGELSSLLASLPTPSNLKRLELGSYLATSFKTEMTSQLPVGLTSLRCNPAWKIDWKLFASTCPPSLTRVTCGLIEGATCDFPYRVGVPLPENLTELSENAVTAKWRETPCFDRHWSESHRLEIPLLEYQPLPQTITSVHLQLVITSTSPIFDLSNLKSLRIQSLSFPTDDVVAPAKKKKIAKAKLDQALNAKIMKLSDAFRRLSFLTKLHLDFPAKDSFFWLRCESLQRQLTDLSFLLEDAPQEIVHLAEFTKLEKISLDSRNFAHGKDNARASILKVWKAIPASVTHLWTRIPTTGLSESKLAKDLSKFQNLKIFEYAGKHEAVSQDDFKFLGRNITTLKVCGIHVSDPFALYEGLDRELSEFDDFELLRSLCPSLTSLRNQTLNGDGILNIVPIKWKMPPTASFKQEELLKALPPRLSRLVWPFPWSPSLVPHLPTHITSLELHLFTDPFQRWEKDVQWPLNLKVLSLAFPVPSSSRTYTVFPTGFLSNLPRTLTGLIATGVGSLSEQDMKEMPPRLEHLILPDTPISSTLIAEQTSLKTLIVMSITLDAFESLPASVREVRAPLEKDQVLPGPWLKDSTLALSHALPQIISGLEKFYQDHLDRA